MQAALEAQKEWNRGIIFDASGAVQAKSGLPVQAKDVQAFTTAFNDRDATFGNGLVIEGTNYEVHRVYEEEGMIYGRTHSIDPQEGEGIALVRTPAAAGGFVYGLVTYRFPILSAKAVPDLQAFLKQWVK
ncbi:hypothetical protein T484DRAFT_1953213 [Baffinella frigidus]|nr:hypothetical protein T484DRAFT_1953213 [Cryptophyta sp. CCMP2293]